MNEDTKRLIIICFSVTLVSCSLIFGLVWYNRAPFENGYEEKALEGSQHTIWVKTKEVPEKKP